MKKYNFGEAYNFYRKFIYNEEKQALLTRHGFHVAGSVPSIDWELFGAILTGDKGKGGYGSDLENYEIKSAIDRASFEYQYHLRGGQTKLADDMKVTHLFISYSSDYKNVEVRTMAGSALKERFKSWLPGLKLNYEGERRKQRFRRSIPYGTVSREGKLILKIDKGNLTRLV